MSGLPKLESGLFLLQLRVTLTPRWKNQLEYIDLHTHTTISDGAYTPRELVRMAHQAGLKALAITDHDTLAGIDEALAEGEKLGIEVIPGLEISVEGGLSGGIHMLGLFVDHNNSELVAAMNRLLRARERRNDQMIALLNQIGISITLEDVAKLAGADLISRAHFAQWFVETGRCGNRTEAFQRFIGAGKKGYVPKEKYGPEQAISIIRNSGGLAALAHPGLMGVGKGYLETLITKLKDMGMQAVEAYYTDHDPGFTDWLIRLAARLDLGLTGGSDFHGGAQTGNQGGCRTGEAASTGLSDQGPAQKITVNAKITTNTGDGKIYQLTVLGSGTCELRAERSAPAYLLSAGNNLLLLDLGQGALRRLMQAGYKANNIKAICFSHHHLDHMADFLPFLFALNFAPDLAQLAHIELFAHHKFEQILESIESVFQPWLTPPPANFERTFLAPGQSHRLADLIIKTTQAKHIETSLAYRFEYQGRSLVYLGDSAASRKVLNLARGADLLITHCAGSDQEPKPGHLHPSAAGELAREAEVKGLILSHLYSEVDPQPALASAQASFPGPVWLAQDFMTFNLESKGIETGAIDPLP
jgi:predicted metal-dependent phosphoesterase TrpH/ribonuclease BN (tRNA processing enzyme)